MTSAMEPGSRLGHYRITEPLAERDLDDFIPAQDTRDGSSVVLEPLPDWLARKRAFIDRIRWRAESLATLEHPRLLAFRSVEKAEGAWFAVLPRVGGKPLEAGIPSNGIELRRLFELADELLDVLEELHGRGLFHGSLHPGNVRFDDAGGYLVVVRASEAPELAESEDAERVPPDIARVAYRAPEQLAGEAMGPQADIFACGALLYQLLTARRPFDGTTPAELARAIREDAPVPVEEIRAELPRQIGQIVQTCLEKDPAARYSSAWALRAHLEGIRSELGGAIRKSPRREPERASAGVAGQDVASDSGAGQTPRDPSAASGAASAMADEASAMADEASGATGAAGHTADQATPDRGKDTASVPSEERRERDADDARRPGRPGTGGPTEDRPADEPQDEPASPRPDRRKPPPPASRAAPTPRPEPTPRSDLRDWRLLVGAVVFLAAGFVAGVLVPGFGPDGNRATRALLSRATFMPGADLAPSPTPDGSRIVYSRWGEGKWSLHVHDVGTIQDRALTPDSGADDVHPAVAPDGDRVAFRSERDGSGIFLVELGDGSLRRVADFGYNPAWSPDGEELLVAEHGVFGVPRGPTPAGTVSRIVVATRERLAVAENALQPDWSPDGDRIAYWSPRQASGAPDGSDLWTAGLEDEGPPVRVTDDAASDWAPVWSPDGRYLYYSSDRGGRVAIWRVPVDSGTGGPAGAPELVIGAGSAEAHSPRFARDSGSMTYVEARSVRSIVRVPFDASRGSVTGAGDAVLEGDLALAMPAPAPRGDRVAFVLDRGTGQELYLAEGGQIMPFGPVSPGPARAAPYRGRLPRWSPDGGRVAFLWNRDGGWQIWAAGPDGADLRRVSDFRRRELAAPVWAPDGSSLAITAGGGFLPFLTFVLDADLPAAEQAPRTLEPMQGEESFEVHSWSRDGAWLAGTVRDGQGVAAGVAVTPVASADYRRVSDFGTHPVWLPDGRRLLFVSGDAVFLADRRGAEPRELLRITPHELDPYVSLSRDGRWIYLTRAVLEADVWIWQESPRAPTSP